MFALCGLSLVEQLTLSHDDKLLFVSKSSKIDNTSGSVLIFDFKSGKLLRDIGDKHPKQFQQPFGLVASRSGILYIGDNANRIHVYDVQKDTFLMPSWGRSGSRQGEITDPGGLALSPDEKELFVVDCQNNRVQVFNTETGKSVRCFGSAGSAHGQFQMPHSIVITPASDVLVTDSSNHRVQMFTSSGQFLRSFGGCGMGKGKFMFPICSALRPAKKGANSETVRPMEFYVTQSGADEESDNQTVVYEDLVQVFV